MAQTDVGKKSFFLELGGSGGLGSLNYEQRLLEGENYALWGRIGFSLAPIDRNNGTGLVFPLMGHMLLGRDKHFLEIGLGQGATVTTRGQFFLLTTSSLGYRFYLQKDPSKTSSNKQKWFFRIAYTPLISYLLDFQVQHWAGLSFGLNLWR